MELNAIIGIVSVAFVIVAVTNGPRTVLRAVSAFRSRGAREKSIAPIKSSGRPKFERQLFLENRIGTDANAAARILLFVRDNRNTSANISLADVLKAVPNGGGTQAMPYYEAVDSLVDAGILKMDLSAEASPEQQDRWERLVSHRDPRNPELAKFQLQFFGNPSAVLISLSPEFYRLQRAIGFSLNEIVRGRTPGVVQVRPSFPPVYQKHDTEVVVLMPFAERYRATYDSAIVPACQEAEKSCSRCDNGSISQQIMGEIYAAISGSTLVIADLSGLNANVLYELGISHTLGKPTLILVDEKTKVPFDLSHVRYIQYQRDLIGLRKLRAELVPILQQA